MRKPVKWGGFIIVFFSSIILLASATFVFQKSVDPLGVWDSKDKVGFNYFKSSQANTQRIFKPFQYETNKPDIVFFGSSRVNYVMPAEWPGVPNEKVYNYGLDAAHMPEVELSFEYALKTHRPKVVLLGLDLIQFSALFNGLKRGFSEDRLKMISYSPLTAHLRKLTDTIFSFDAIVHSIKTIKANKRERYEEPAFINGWRTKGDKIKRRSGEYRRVLAKYHLLQYRRFKYAPSNYLKLQRILEIAEKEDIKVILYFNPFHADFLITIDVNGKWDDLENLKRRLVRLAPLWDFGYLNEVTSDRDNFFDPSHFLPKIGRKMTRVMAKGVENDFGVLLTKENIASELTAQRALYDKWAGEHQKLYDLQVELVKTKNKKQFQKRVKPLLLPSH